METSYTDANRVTTTTTATTAATPAVMPALRRISWGAVFAGAVLALVLQLALSLLGLGIGLGTIDPLEEQNPMAGIGIGAAIWWVVSMLISLYIGGSVAGRLAGMPRRTDGLLHGLLTWSLVTLLTFYLLSTAVGRIIGGVSGVAGRALGAAGRGIAAVAPEAADAVKSELQERGIDLNDLKREARTILRQTGKAELQPENLERQAQAAGNAAKSEAQQSAVNPQAADDNFDDVIDQLFSRGENVVNAADRDAAVNVVMQRTGKSRAEAEQIVSNWQQTYEQARVKWQQTKQQVSAQARQTGDAAAEGLSKAALLAALGLGLGAAAAAFGGRQAVPHDAAVPAVGTVA
ncbi:phage holin family protein [Hymenobacter weizhouensis]|uniref:phage holin family protein n=1 Tax=Hymenobacter sp. YIM 151500-1 TaxID=2987689 RepID=UPI0022262687|nr:phage holin family protein [Hymenobacter sp. YIM 151500-1]UYZ65023.1 phage holin family protein [Hymenobacter sp. YIM 151500-1]